MVKVQFTATVVNPDTEEEFNGWVNPQNRYELRTLAEDVPTFEFETLPEAVAFIEGEIGMTENEAGSDIWYSGDEDFHMESVESWHRAAHITQD